MKFGDKDRYRLMGKVLDDYEAGKSDIGYVISGLESLVNALEHPGQEWNAAFWKPWEELDMVVSVSIGSREFGGANDEALIERTIAESFEAFRKMLSERGPQAERQDETESLFE